ncbi:MAG: ABC transporter substrate-binding protein [Rhodococcus sp.]|nr:ABC transporter substrate-binding protein [Rhodococcus sp. (in: high G+C Gram-positive bacteria)]
MRAMKFSAVALLGALVVGISGCSSSDADEIADGRVTTIDHKFGATTITGTPTRIVAADTQWLDVLLELGIQPVGYLSAGTMGDERGLFPWESGVDASAKELDRSAIQQVGVPLKAEEVAALDPDLILGGFSVADQDDFDQLSKIAPTIAGLSEVQVDPWQDQVEILGRVLDKESRADEIVEATNGQIDALAQRLPGLKGKTALLSQYVFPTSQLVIVADPKDGASGLFTRLGMSLPPKLVEEAGVTGGRLMLSPERVDALSADVVVLLPNGGTLDDMMKLPGFADLPAVKSGGLAIVDYPTVAGLNTPSSLSVKYSLESITPQLEAVAG